MNGLSLNFTFDIVTEICWNDLILVKTGQTHFTFRPTYIYDPLPWLILIKTMIVLYEVHTEAQATDEQWTRWTVNINC